MLSGAAGRVLKVDLSTGEIEHEHPDPSFYRLYMGGGGWGTYYLLRETPRGVDPFAPENLLVFSLSVVTGAPVSGLSRCTLTAKSPLTGAIGDSQAGGFWPVELKLAGFDALVVRGRSPKPVYLWIHDGEVELRDASHLWGRITWEVESALRDELADDKIEVAQIGPAGERRVRFASVMNMSNRAHGRTGLGAVMGAKRLKAVVVRGHCPPSLADKAAVTKLARRAAAYSRENQVIQNFGEQGTPTGVEDQNVVGGLPTRNYQGGFFEGADAISGQRLNETLLVDRHTCHACIVRCKRVVEIKSGPYEVDRRYGGPEYESIAGLGSYCGISDLAAVVYANQLCAQNGLDTISAGATIAFAMECFERGLIRTEDTGGVPLRFGDAEAMVNMLEKIVAREGIGDLLAEGSWRAAQTLGPEAQKLVVAVKGQELPAHMPQLKRSLGLIYAVNPFGADHASSEHDHLYIPGIAERYLPRLARLGLNSPTHHMTLNEDKVRFALATQYHVSALDALGLCQFVWGPTWQLMGPEDIADLVNAVTGWGVTEDEIQKMGARRVNLMRAFNAREGFNRMHDVLPERLFEPLRGGVTNGLTLSREEMERALDLYYGMAGWDPITGNPPRDTLEGLELGWVADLLGLDQEP